MKKLLLEFYRVYLREFHLVKSDMGIMIFLFLLPVAYPIIYSLIYNPELVRNVPVVVVDADRSQRSRDLVRNLDATEGVRILGYAADLPEARKAVDSHEAYGILSIPEGFGRKIERNEQANAVIYSDMSLLLRYRAMLVASTQVMSAMGSEITTERIDRIAPFAATISSGDPMPVNNIQMGNLSGGFDSFIMPGVLMLIFQQSIVLAIGMAGGAKHENRRLLGYDPLNSGKSVIVAMFGQMACYLTLLIVPLIFLAHYVPLIFQFPMAGGTLQIFLFLAPYTIAACCLGFTLQGVVKEREGVFVIWVATSIVFLFLSGLTWPRFAMAGVWKFLSDCIPATWAIEGFIRMNANGASLAQAHTCYINLWILAAVYFIGACLVQKFLMPHPAPVQAPEVATSQKASKQADTPAGI